MGRGRAHQTAAPGARRSPPRDARRAPASPSVPGWRTPRLRAVASRVSCHVSTTRRLRRAESSLKYTRACEYHIASFGVNRDDGLAIWPAHARRLSRFLKTRHELAV